MSQISIARALSTLAVASFALASVAQAESEHSFKEGGFSSPDQLIDYMTIKEIKTVQTGEERLSPDDARRMGLPDVVGGALGAVGGSIIDGLSNPSTWLTLGQKAWDIIVAGKPVANVSMMRVSVMPVSTGDWAQMENWQGPAVKSFSVNATNLMGMEVVKFNYRVAYSYGGTLGQKGAYLANLAVIPDAVSVTWAFKLNANVQVENVVNTSSKDSPIPGVEMMLTYMIDSPLKHIEGRDSFFVKGNGEAVRLGSN